MDKQLIDARSILIAHFERQQLNGLAEWAGLCTTANELYLLAYFGKCEEAEEMVSHRDDCTINPSFSPVVVSTFAKPKLTGGK